MAEKGYTGINHVANADDVFKGSKKPQDYLNQSFLLWDWERKQGERGLYYILDCSYVVPPGTQPKEQDLISFSTGSRIIKAQIAAFPADVKLPILFKWGIESQSVKMVAADY